MGAPPEQVAGLAEFARYAFPPNELGYCGPADSSVLLRADNPADVAAHAREFDGAWPYLRAIADAVGADPLNDDVVRAYWVGGPLLGRVDSSGLLVRLREAFAGQATGLLTALPSTAVALSHHSFHVFVVYPWVRCLDNDPTPPVRILQSCRIRWGTVDSVEDDHAVILSRPLDFGDGALVLGGAAAERERWRKDGSSLLSMPAPGDTVASHWDWLCATLADGDAAALATATQATLDLVNNSR